MSVGAPALAPTGVRPALPSRRQGFRSVMLLCLALLAAAIAQGYLARRQFPLDGAIFYVVAIVLFVRATRFLPDAEALPAAQPASYSLLRAAPALALGIVAVAALVAGSSSVGLLLTAASLGALVTAYWRQALASAGRIHLEVWEWAALAGIVLLGLFLRIYQISSFPGSLYLDEGDVGSLALKMVRGGAYTPFVPDFTGHPTLFYYGLGFFLKIVGISVIKLRLYTVMIGTLAIIATYALGREMLGRRAALVAAFAMAISAWAIAFSRIAFDGIAVVLFAALAMYFLARGMRTFQPMDFIWAGLAMGLGLNTYLAFRVVPLIALLYLGYSLLSRRAQARSLVAGIALFVLATLITFAPLGVYYLRHPSDALARTEAASVLLDIQREKSNAPLYANIRKAIGMFNYSGDPRPRHNLPNSPQLDPITGVLFALGFGFALLKARRPENAALVTWLVVGMIPGVLSLADSNPHSLRTITNLPAVCLLAALSAERIDMLLRTSYRERARRWLPVLAAIAGFLALVANMHAYFDLQANNRSTYYDFDPIQNSVAQVVRSAASSHDVYVASTFTNHSAVKFLDDGIPYQTFSQAAHLPARQTSNKDLLYVLEPVQRSLLPLFQKVYPGATISEWKDKYGGAGYTKVEVKANDAQSVQGANVSYAPSAAGAAPSITRTEQIAADWGSASPVTAPFTATWSANLYAPKFGSYALILDSTHPATLTLDSQATISTTGGTEARTVPLYGGFHNLQVTTTVPNNAGSLSLRWRTPDGQEQVIPRESLFTFDLASNGLVGKYYRGNTWSGSPAAQQKDLFILPNDLLPAPFSIEWQGKIYAPQDGQYVFGTSSDDGSLLYIDDKLVVDNGGHHSERYMEGRTTLTQGLHDIRLRYFQDDGGRIIDLYWTPPNGRRDLVPSAALFPPDTALSGTIALELPEPVSSTVAPGLPAAAQTPGARPQALPASPGSAIPLAPLFVVGREGSGPGEFRNPRGVAVDKGGNIYVADTGNKRVQKLDSSGKFIAEWKGGKEPFVEPAAVVVGPDGDFYVLEPEKDGAQHFSARGDFLGKVGDGLGLYRPRGLNADSTGNLYFANTGGNNVVKANASGQMAGTIGSGGKKDGQLDQPTDAVLDASGNVYVVDSYNQRIQRFTADGRYALQWPIPAAGTVLGPHAAMAPDGVLFATDPDGHRLSAYSTQGAPLGSWGSQGTGDGQFVQPTGICADAAGRIFVADTGNSRIQVWGKR